MPTSGISGPTRATFGVEGSLIANAPLLQPTGATPTAYTYSGTPTRGSGSYQNKNLTRTQYRSSQQPEQHISIPHFGISQHVHLQPVSVFCGVNARKTCFPPAFILGDVPTTSACELSCSISTYRGATGFVRAIARTPSTAYLSSG